MIKIIFEIKFLFYVGYIGMLYIVVWKIVYLYRKFRNYYYKFYVCIMKNGFFLIMILFVLMILIIFKLLMEKMKNYKRLENIICFKKVMNIKKVIRGFILWVNFEF